MGSRPSKPSDELEALLKQNLDERCASAAKTIVEADIFLLCTGAGFSADSGLAIYADVAKVDAYARRDLKYHDICRPDWLAKEPDLFWGFWGQCYNDYRETPPHKGFEIISRWVDRHFRSSVAAEHIRKRILEMDAMKEQKPSNDEPYEVTDKAGAFFVFTSNVDAHHFDWFRACEIRECHGNTELYQCGAGRSWKGDDNGAAKKACTGVWRAPLNFSFEVDKATMLAPVAQLECAPADALEEVAQEEAAAGPAPDLPGTSAASQDTADGDIGAPRVGNVKGGGRSTMLRHMPVSAPLGDFTEEPSGTNRPICPNCKGPARPAILMFGDTGWIDNKSQYRRYDEWLSAVTSYIEEAVREIGWGQRIKVAILEIGAGDNVPTVRSNSENLLDLFRESGAEAKLIRTNPELPLGDEKDHAPGGKYEDDIISIMGRGLDSILRIDASMQKLA